MTDPDSRQRHNPFAGGRHEEASYGRSKLPQLFAWRKSIMIWNRVLSLLVAVGYLIFAANTRGLEGVNKTLIFLILPLACIWFSDAIGEYTETGSAFVFGFSPRISRKTPGIFVCLIGWVFLFMPVILYFVGKYAVD